MLINAFATSIGEVPPAKCKCECECECQVANCQALPFWHFPGGTFQLQSLALTVSKPKRAATGIATGVQELKPAGFCVLLLFAIWPIVHVT